MSPQVRALAPLEGEQGPIGIGQVVYVSEEQANEWRAAGKVSLVADEEAAEERAQHGVYDAVVGRDDVAGTPGGQTPPGPQADDEDDKPAKKGKK